MTPETFNCFCIQPFSSEEVPSVTKLRRSMKLYTSTNQHGVVKERSVITNLTEITQYINAYLDGGQQVGVVYTDLVKAFDSVDHATLVLKLGSLRFSFCCDFIS
ncbi:hypothetical protein Trydic_g22733 [Trypoxylus dichotomus]